MLSNDDNDDVKLKGGTDATIIGNVGDRLKTDNTISGITGSITASFSSKMRVDTVTTPVILTTGSFVTCYSYSGSGNILGFSAEFNNSNIVPRFTVDGENIFTGATLSTWGGFQVASNSTDRRQSGSGIVTNGANIDWSLRQPLKFNTSISITADANGGAASSRQLTQFLIYIEKVT